jgi:hypothetical protein
MEEADFSDKVGIYLRNYMTPQSRCQWLCFSASWKLQISFRLWPIFENSKLNPTLCCHSDLAQYIRCHIRYFGTKFQDWSFWHFNYFSRIRGKFIEYSLKYLENARSADNRAGHGRRAVYIVSSFARKPRSWVPITHKARMFWYVYVFILCLCCPVFRQRPCDELITRPRSPTVCKSKVKEERIKLSKLITPIS